MAQIIGNTILGKFSLDSISRAAGSVSIRISTLDHESTDNTMEDKPVIKAFLHQTDEVVDGVGSDLRI